MTPLKMMVLEPSFLFIQNGHFDKERKVWKKVIVDQENYCFFLKWTVGLVKYILVFDIILTEILSPNEF